MKKTRAELFDENQELRAVVAKLERSRTALTAQLGVEQGVLSAYEADRRELGRSRKELAAARRQCTRLKGEVRAHAAHEQRLADQLASVEAQVIELGRQRSEVDTQLSRLATMIGAVARLNAAAELRATLRVIAEVVVNLVGSERFAVFEVDADAGVMTLCEAVGLAPEPLHRLVLGADPLSRVARTGVPYLGGAAASGSMGETLVAGFPLESGGHVRAVVAIYGLLAHKSELQAFDRELFEMIGPAAARALERTGGSAGQNGGEGHA